MSIDAKPKMPALAVATLGLLMTSGATAEDRIKPRAEAFERLVQCQEIAADAARLACFDSQVTAMKAGADRNELVVLDREEIKKTRRSLFGLSIPRLPFFGDGNDQDVKKADAIIEINAKLTAVSSLNGGLWSFKLDDDTRWQTIEPFETITPKPGMAISIRRAALGSFLAKINDRRPVRIKRIG
ncbi:MAG: hypothetical protein ACSLE1_15255 [Sphingobium sp.]